MAHLVLLLCLVWVQKVCLSVKTCGFSSFCMIRSNYPCSVLSVKFHINVNVGEGRKTLYSHMRRHRLVFVYSRVVNNIS